MRPVLRHRVWLVFAVAASFGAGCARTNNNTPRGPTTPSTLEAARRGRYLIAASVSGDPNGMGPAGTPDQLRQWVGTYLSQVGLPPAGSAPGPGDVELRLTLSAHGGSLLVYGTATMAAVANGQVIDQWVSSEHVEPATSFARTMARELVEAMVHSTRLATYADSASGGRAAPGAPPPGFTMATMALAPGPPPATEGSVTPPPVGIGAVVGRDASASGCAGIIDSGSAGPRAPGAGPLRFETLPRGVRGIRAGLLDSSKIPRCYTTWRSASGSSGTTRMRCTSIEPTCAASPRVRRRWRRKSAPARLRRP